MEAMGRTRKGLTPERAQQKSKRPGLHLDAAGLYLRVSKTSETSKSAASSWVFRYMLNGKAREMGLGSYPGVSLGTARKLAEEQRSLKGRGIDPIDARDASRIAQRVEAARSITFRDCAKAYVQAHAGKWKNAKHAKQWEATLEAHVMPVLGDIPVSAVDRALVIKVLEPIWSEIPETASRVRGRMEAILAWAEMRDYRTGDNPAAWKGRLDKVFPPRSEVQQIEHHAALPYAEVADFVASLTAQEGTASQALMFTILTAARTGEVTGARWSEFDMDKSQWTVPGARMKNGREHRVPLSPPAMKVLRHQLKLTGGEGYVFPGMRPKKPLSNMAMLMLLERMKRDDLTVHGFRSTFRDWVEEQTAYPGSVAEAALAHAVGDKVEAAYRRGDLFEKRKQLMNAWARHCTTPAQSGKVIPIKNAARSK
jgi:integrase